MVCPARRVRRVLRNLGLKPSSVGNRTGHEKWIHPDKGFVLPALRKKDISYSCLHALSLALEARGIARRRDFWAEVRI